MSELINKQAVLWIINELSFVGFLNADDMRDAVELLPVVEERKKSRYIDSEELKHILNNSKYYGTKAGNAFADMIAECETII